MARLNPLMSPHRRRASAACAVPWSSRGQEQPFSRGNESRLKCSTVPVSGCPQTFADRDNSLLHWRLARRHVGNPSDVSTVSMPGVQRFELDFPSPSLMMQRRLRAQGCGEPLTSYSVRGYENGPLRCSPSAADISLLLLLVSHLVKLVASVRCRR